MQVSATIVKGCTIAATGAGQWGSIDFGTVNGMAQGTTDASLISTAGAGIQLECTPGTTISVSADNGTHASNGVRRLGLNGGTTATVSYQLFADGSTTPWTTQALSIAFPVGTSKRSLPVLGRATFARPMTAGAYSDTVRVTITW
jgi:spore coat protein U-like protein